MPEYLTKEEVRQWRSSLERITLEEYAARLGKVIQGEKHTNDMIDKVMANSLNNMSDTSEYRVQSEKLQTIVIKPITKKTPAKIKQQTDKNASKKPAETTKPQKQEEIKENKAAEEKEISITFKKPLIPREQLIFDYLLKNKNVVVYAKEMASLLELPRDYVYKYIKNLRQKINEEVLFNADNGGYVLKA